MADATHKRSFAWGPCSALGLCAAVLTAALDQGVKLWLLWVFDLPARGDVAVTPFFDLVLVWNTGISYGLFPQNSAIGQWTLLAIKAAVIVLLWVWLARAGTRLIALSLGLIIGAAVGNAIDRLHWPGVMDFVLLHATIGGTTYNWYVFNLADAAIVAGVVGLLYESAKGERAAKAPRSGI